MFESQEETEPASNSGPAVLVLLLITLPVCLLLRRIGQPYLAITAPACLLATFVVVGLCWDLRTRPWFWCVIVIVLALHVYLLPHFKWPQNPNLEGRALGFAMLAVALVDGTITLGVVRLVGKFAAKPAPDDQDD